ncbi:MAG: RNA polymerase sigma factor [Gracilibacteraceae bacterium]|nr:RNA polymerase sigma factor [Gracilibacteraceae bacterium]
MDDEPRLISKIQKKGDRAAADTLIRRYYDEIYRYVRRQIADKDAAMDLTQEVFLSALRAVSRFDGKQAGFRTWLYKIATDKTVDYFRSRAVRRRRVLAADELELPDEADADFTRRIEQADLAERVTRYVNALSAETQAVFRLRSYGGHTFAEIAALLSVPESSVKSKYYRLLRALRKEFGNEWD